MELVRIFDTTLRDGEQSPGATLTQPEKLEIARHLEAMGVDVIEAGFPISSPGDFESVQAIASEITKSTVCGLARCAAQDIDRAGEAVKGAARSRIHVFCATSKIHREHKLRKGKEEILKLSVRSIRHALEYTKDVEFSPEDASRTELEFLEEIVQAAIEAGARQVECTINGIGERAGNAALEEIVMAIKTRADIFPYETGIDATQLVRASKLVSAVTSFPV